MNNGQDARSTTVGYINFMYCERYTGFNYFEWSRFILIGFFFSSEATAPVPPIQLDVHPAGFVAFEIPALLFGDCDVSQFSFVFGKFIGYSVCLEP